MGGIFDLGMDLGGGASIADPLDLGGTQAAAAADKAAGYVTQAAKDAVAEQRRQSDITKANLAPWVTAGKGALQSQQALTGVLGSAKQQEAINAMQPTPGQLFMQQQQEKEMLAKAAATGGLGGGNIRADLNKLGVLNSIQNYNTNYNRLAGISGTGQTTASNLSELGQAGAGNIANLQQQAGQARSSGILGQAQAQAQGMNNLMGLGAGLYGAFGGGGGGGIQQPQGATTYAVPQNNWSPY